MLSVTKANVSRKKTTKKNKTRGIQARFPFDHDNDASPDEKIHTGTVITRSLLCEEGNKKSN